MNILYFQKVSLIDMPGHVASVVYCQGCNRNCEYCHNPESIPQDVPGKIKWNEVISYLKTRLNQIDAVIFSGGEPTLQEDLLSCIEQCQDMGFKIGMHTNGDGPYYEAAAPLCDYILLSHYNNKKIEIAEQAKEVQLSKVIKDNFTGTWENKISSVSANIKK